MSRIVAVHGVAARIPMELDEKLDRIAAGEVDDILTATFDHGWSPPVPL